MLEQELSEMDRITQLQDGIAQLLATMSHSIEYLVSHADFAQVSSDIPITKSRGDKAVPPEVFEVEKRDLVDQLVQKAKQVEFLIQSLPPPDPEDEQTTRLQKLEEDMQVANREYREAVERAKSLQQQVTQILHQMLDVKGPLS